MEKTMDQAEKRKRLRAQLRKDATEASNGEGGFFSVTYFNFPISQLKSAQNRRIIPEEVDEGEESRDCQRPRR
jgi:hypothetical protein